MTEPGSPASGRYDVVIVGAGHNGLVAATLLARAGRSVLVLERREQVGGAAISGTPFPGVGVRLSRYAYLVSLFPVALLRRLGVTVELRARDVASYTPSGNSGVLVSADEAGTRASIARHTGDPGAFDSWQRFHATLGGLARRLFPTLLEPLRSRRGVRELIGDDAVWRAVFEEPLSGVLERTFADDLLRGIVLTDATIGTFAPAGDPLLRQNRCFLYHVIGNGTGRWDVPAGGIGAVTMALRDAAVTARAEIRTRAEVVEIGSDGTSVEVECADGRRLQARHLLANLAPAELARLTGTELTGSAPEGSQLKVNMLLSRLPRLRDPAVSSEQAFAGTFHVNEGYEQLQQAYAEADAGRIPSLPPCELYCHSLTDPSILAPELRAAGAHTLTLFGLHMPERLFRATADGGSAPPAGPGPAGGPGPAVGPGAAGGPGPGSTAKQAALAATLRSINSVLAEPLEDCLMSGPDGSVCLEAVTPPELEAQLRMPGGHIFHRDLAWPFAETEEEVGHWGVETEWPNVWLCGAGARRGGGVSGIPGHNAARAVLAARS